MEKEEFKINFFGNKLWELILEKTKIIIITVQLIIALLAIASFSEKIVNPENTQYLKILIIILLSLIPVMLTDYIIQLDNGIKSIQKELSLNLDLGKTWYRKMIDGSNYIYMFITIVIIDSIIYLINQSYLILLLIILLQIISIATFIFSEKIAPRKKITSPQK